MLGDFYQVRELTTPNESTIKAVIELNPGHDIFKGHFPGNPIAPGVCLVQIIKELTERGLNRKLFMHKADNIKFMAKINPDVDALLHLDLDLKRKENEEIGVSCSTYSGETVFLKFKGTFR